MILDHKDVPSSQVSVHKPFAGQILHPKSNLLRELQEHGAGFRGQCFRPLPLFSLVCFSTTILSLIVFTKVPDNQ